MSRDHPTRDDVDDELICKDCHRYVGEDETRCPRCKERWRAGF
jgi:uncharacterized paraquat-inducible protein A